MTHRESTTARLRWRLRGLVTVTGIAAVAGLSAVPAQATTTSHQLAANTRFALHQPDPAAVQQVGQLLKQHDFKDAALVTGELLTPQADWFTKGTPQEVRKAVHRSVVRAAALHRVPTLVVYNVPGRDCSQYSSGGAATDAAYHAWIDGFVKGLGNAKAVVVVEPDGLANLPSDCAGAYPGQDVAALTAGRIADVKYAGAQVESKDPNSSVYLDAGNSAWHNTGDIASRLVDAGVTGLQGFALNVSNYQYTQNSDFYGTWVSDCIAYATVVAPGDFASCPNQYWNGGPLDGYASGVALNRYGVWSTTSPEQDLNVANLNAHWAAMLGSTTPTAHFIVDTSRNGRGPNDMSAYAAAPVQPAGRRHHRPAERQLVQPARRRSGRETHREHRGAPRRRLPVGENRGRVRRPVQHRRRRQGLGLHRLQRLGLELRATASQRPAVGHHRPSSRRLVPTTSHPAGKERGPLATGSLMDVG